MNRIDFFKQAKAGDTVVLRSNMRDIELYGTHHYVSSMKLVDNEGIIRELIPDDYSFYIKGKGCFRYTPEMVDHVRFKNPEYVEREKKVSEMIDLNGILPVVREFVRDRLIIGDVVRIDRYPDLNYYSKATMLAPGRTAKIILSAEVRKNDEIKDRKFRLDKDLKSRYTVDVFDLAYIISRNDHLYRDFKIVFGSPLNCDKETAEKFIVKDPTIEKRASVHINTEEIIKGIDKVIDGLVDLKKAFKSLA